MKKLHLPIIALFILGAQVATAQVKIGSNPTTINSNSLLEMEATNKGMLMPRVALTATNNASPLSSHIQGMTIYNTAVSGSGSTAVSEGFYYNDGTKWVKIQTQTSIAGDLKQSFLTTDNNGWYLLDGRAINTLPATAQSTATALGFTTNLPNATDRILKTTNGIEAMAATGGANTLSITQANLPNLNLSGTVSGTTSSDGAHQHTPAAGGFLLGGTSINNNGAGQYSTNTGGVPSAWGGVGFLGSTASAGSHSHTVTGTATVSTGGAGTTLDNRSPFLVVNTFIYLGL